MKLRTKFVGLLVPLVVLPLLFLGWVAFKQLHESAQVKTFDAVAESLSRQRQLMAAEIRVAIANVELLSNYSLIRKYFLTDDESERYSLLQRPVLQLLKSYQQAYPEYDEIRALLPDGYEDVRWTRAELDHNVTDEESDSAYFQAMKHWPEDAYTTVFRNPDNRALSLLVTRRMLLKDYSIDSTNTEPTLRGYLAVTVSLADFRHTVSEQTIGGNGFYFATDAAGAVLLRPEQYAAEDLLPSLQSSELIRAALAGERLQTKFGGSAAYVEGLQLHRDLYLFALLPADQLLQSSRSLGYNVAIITAIAIIVAVAALLAALHYIVIRPLGRLGEATKNLGRGELSIEVGSQAKDEIGDLASSFREMSKNLRESQEHIQFLAYYDSLTGLPNRPMFQECLERAVGQASRTGETLAVLFLDLDNFKRINDTLGHHIGDSLLQKFSESLTRELRHEDYVSRVIASDADSVVARLGGDEFILLLRDIKDQFSAGQVAQRICNLLTTPFVVAEHELFVSTSIGISLYPDDATNGNNIIKNADIAMYHAKEQGRNNYQYYAASMNLASSQRLLMENKLRRALDKQQFELHYQPQVDCVSGTIVGAEALIRWMDPELGMVSPDDFIPIAEETGLIVPIGEWVINQVCLQARSWQQMGLPPIDIAVNISAVQVARADLAAVIKRALARHQLEARYLDVEITESTIMSTEDSALQTFGELRSLGASISLDDFGTGYSSLSYLQKFPFTNLKIDRSFVGDFSRDANARSIVIAIIAMAHSLNLQVIAEGVEDAQQMAFLREQRCDFAQGYLISRPLVAADFAALLRRENLIVA